MSNTPKSPASKALNALSDTGNFFREVVKRLDRLEQRSQSDGSKELSVLQDLETLAKITEAGFNEIGDSVDKILESQVITDIQDKTEALEKLVMEELDAMKKLVAFPMENPEIEGSEEEPEADPEKIPQMAIFGCMPRQYQTLCGIYKDRLDITHMKSAASFTNGNIFICSPMTTRIDMDKLRSVNKPEVIISMQGGQSSWKRVINEHFQL